MSDNDYRQRAAATKRLRTRLAITKAANELFEKHGWQGTRLQDVAKEAGVGVATVHGYFATKHALISRVFGGAMAAMIEDGQRLLNETEDVLQTIRWMLSKLVETSVRRRNITAAMAAAMVEQPLVYPEYEEGQLPEDFGVAALVAALSDLIVMGQEDGTVNPELPAFQVAAYHVTETLLVIAMNPEMSGGAIERLVLSQAMPALSGPREVRSQNLEDEQKEYLASAIEGTTRLRNRAAGKADRSKR